jgi:hypothetical protein
MVFKIVICGVEACQITAQVGFYRPTYVGSILYEALSQAAAADSGGTIPTLIFVSMSLNASCFQLFVAGLASSRGRHEVEFSRQCSPRDSRTPGL